MNAHLALSEAVAQTLLISSATVSASLGILALASPRVFSLLVARSNTWIDVNRFFPITNSRVFRLFDRRVDVDRYALRHSRKAGIAMLVAAVVLAGLCVVG